jgi:DNA-binding CsgD family transcriptional regulator
MSRPRTSEQNRFSSLHRQLVRGWLSVSGGDAGFCYVGGYLDTDKMVGSVFRSGRSTCLDPIRAECLQRLATEGHNQAPTIRYVSAREPWDDEIVSVLSSDAAAAGGRCALLIPLLDGARLIGIVGATTSVNANPLDLEALGGLAEALSSLSRMFSQQLELTRWLEVSKCAGTPDAICCVVDNEVSELIWVGSRDRQELQECAVRRCAPEVTLLAKRLGTDTNEPLASYASLECGAVIDVKSSASLETFGPHDLSVVAIRPGRNRSQLSAREDQIARLLVAGYAVVNAAALMGLSENTVRTYVRRIYQKLLVKSRAEFIRAYASAAAAHDSSPAGTEPR